MRKLILLGLLFFAGAIMAQEATPEPETTPLPEITAEATEFSDDDDMCPMLVNNALELTNLSCDGTDTNEACYGFTFIDSELRSPTVQFTEPGDVLDVVNIESLQLSPMDVELGQWGLMVMAVEANVQGNPSLDNDDVQIVLFGDTQLRDASEFVQITATSAVNLRLQPNTTAQIIDSLEAGETVIANSRLDDDSWFRVRINTDEGSSIAWVASQFVEAATDISVLPTLTTEEAENTPEDIAAQYGPMQAFYFSSAEDDAPCAEAPNSGMLIQTPEGVASVTLWLDEVVIQLDGTGVISAQADGDLTVNVIDGAAQVEANGDTRTVVAGQATDIELDNELSPISVPSDPRAINSEDVQAVPVGLLDNNVQVPTVTDIDSNLPIAGEWQFSLNQPPPYVCSDGTEIPVESLGQNAIIRVDPQADALIYSGLQFNQSTEGVYNASYTDSSSNLIQDTLQVVSTDRIVGDRVVDFLSPICTLNLSFTLQLVTPQ